MQIAILGGTSQIARDFLNNNNLAYDQCDIFSRNIEKTNSYITLNMLHERVRCYYLTSFPVSQYDVVINFIGTGDPKRCAEMGASIFDITYEYDQLVLNYLKQNPDCKYIFLSSGAAYGGTFDAPVTEQSQAKFDFNKLKPHDYYAVAKFYTECRHRAMPNHAIYDVRVFNYFSHSHDINARFLMTDIVRALHTNTTLKTSPSNIIRDYITPPDFSRLMQSIIQSKPTNIALDCYTKAPVDKLSLLKLMQERYGLVYEITNGEVSVNATGAKPHYYSLNKSAEALGYSPAFSSIEGIELEMDAMIKHIKHTESV